MIPLVSESESHTQEIAIRLLPYLEAGMVLLLNGPIGAGKSVFARAIISSLLAKSGMEEDIPSPTFTLVQSYETEEFDIWHVDLYRIESELEIIELGLEEAFETSLCIIEWGEKLGRFTPDNHIEISFEPMTSFKSGRRLTFTTKDSKYAHRIARALE